MRAFQRGDLPAADNLLVRATALLSDDSERRRELLTELGLSLRLTGQGQRAEEALAKAIAASEHAQDQRLRLRGELELTNIRIFAGGDSEELLEVAGRAIPVFEAIGDDRSLGRAWLLCGMVKGTFQCKNAEWEDALEHALVHYRRARWPTTACVGELAAALFYGPRPVDEGMLRCNALLREDAGRVGSANVLVWMAGLQAMKGGFAEAREGVAHARGILDEFGFAVAAAGSCDYVAAYTELLAGDYEEAERILRRSCETFERLGSSAYLATRAADLAEALYAQGNIDEASPWAESARRHAADGDVSAQFSWRPVLAKVLAHQGATHEAERLAREAVALVAETDALNQRAHVLLSLAEVHRLAGRADEATRGIDEAARLFAQKGNVVAAGRANELRTAVAVV